MYRSFIDGLSDDVARVSLNANQDNALYCAESWLDKSLSSTTMFYSDDSVLAYSFNNCSGVMLGCFVGGRVGCLVGARVG